MITRPLLTRDERQLIAPSLAASTMMMPRNITRPLSLPFQVREAGRSHAAIDKPLSRWRAVRVARHRILREVRLTARYAVSGEGDQVEAHQHHDHGAQPAADVGEVPRLARRGCPHPVKALGNAVQRGYAEAPRRVGRQPRDREEAGGGRSGRFGGADHSPSEEGRQNPSDRSRHRPGRKRAARMGRNPATGATIKIKASKKVAFRPARELKEAV